MEIPTAEPLIPETGPLEVGFAVAKLKSPGSDQIPAELIQAGDEILRSEIHKVINSVRNKEELPEQWKQSGVSPVYKKGIKGDCSDFRDISLL
jgi:hypothetical protein